MAFNIKQYILRDLRIQLQGHQESRSILPGEFGSLICKYKKRAYFRVFQWNIVFIASCSSLFQWFCIGQSLKDRQGRLIDAACFLVLTPIACVSAYLCVEGALFYLRRDQSDYDKIIGKCWT